MIITVGRQYGSGGHEIGEKIAKELGIKFVDEQIIDLAAEKSGVYISKIMKTDETRNGNIAETKGTGDYQVLKTSPMYRRSESDNLFTLESQIICREAEESCVVVGHCGNYVLRDIPKALSVYVYAPKEFRINRVMEYYKVATREEAIKEIKRMDKIRRNYYEYYAEYKWGGKEGRDMLIDSSMFGIDATAHLLADIAKQRFELL